MARNRKHEVYEPFKSQVDAVRVSGGICPNCGFHRLPQGVCGVCFHARRVKGQLQRLESMRVNRNRKECA